MILLNNIQGQDNAIRYLVNSLKTERISDSYLFSGPRGVGRILTAKAFIMNLICSKGSSGVACGVCSSCKRIDNLEHPDLLHIKPEKNKVIKIDQIRQAKDKLYLKPFEANISVCLIEDAHMMTVKASNALLKVLEEPPGESMIILVSDKKENLLPTVISRCTEVRFRSLSISKTQSIVERIAKVSSREALFLAYFSQGSPGVSLEMIEEEVLEKREIAIGVLDEILSVKRLSCASWTSEKKDDLIETADMLVMILRDIVMFREGSSDKMLDPDIRFSKIYSFFEKYSVNHIYNVVEKLISLKSGLMGSVNPKLVAQILPGCLEGFTF